MADSFVIRCKLVFASGMQWSSESLLGKSLILNLRKALSSQEIFSL